MDHSFLFDITDTRHMDGFGKKGAGLHWLVKHRLLIPNTLVLTYSASDMIKQDPPAGFEHLGNVLKDRLQPAVLYAVRSSSNLEDDKELSFAGQFLSRTNVQGLDAVLDAVRDVLNSSKSETLQPYLQKLGESGKQLKMAVLVQDMITPKISGVAFSKNPTTGLDEVVIEAVHGLGDALMEDGITPARWIYRWGQFTNKPESEAEFEEVIRQIANESRRIQRLYGSPVDLEWAYDGKNIYWLQIRPITALTNVPLYSNRISREVLPGIIKPLIASVNIPLVNTAWIRLFDSWMGKTNLKPEDLTSLFHYRAYFNMGAIATIFEILGFPREGLEMLLGFKRESKRPPFSPSLKTFRHIPRILGFAARAWTYDRSVKAELAEFETHIQKTQAENIKFLSSRELLAKIDEHFKFNTLVAYQNIVIPILMNLYNAVLKSQLKRVGVEFVDFNLTEGLPQVEDYDPNHHLDEMHNRFNELPQSVQEKIRTLGYRELKSLPEAGSFLQLVDEFIKRFGHLSESGNDFSKTPWREEPEKIIRMVLNHAISARDGQKTTWETLKASVFLRMRMRPIYQRARTFRLMRERISSMYTASYGWFRVYFNELAERFTKDGVLDARDDIFYLTRQEVRSLVERTGDANELKKKIQAHKDNIERSRDIVMPEIIYGNAAPPLDLLKSDAKKLTGIPTSSGYYQGRLKVVRSNEDFHRVEKGDVIVIPFSDVAWTPLFAKAGAVVAESGGILSHSSIVAREYGIPCVVSVNGACNLPEGSEVIVDGYQGAVSGLGS
jgi:pyruvate,water dikinase